jgi:diguanylate cyclase (GGDEF)-like protein
MSFRTRLTLLFVVIVLVAMTGFGVLVFKLIADAQRGQADARVAALAGTALGAYRRANAEAAPAARRVAGDARVARAVARSDRSTAVRVLRVWLGRERLVRIEIRRGGRVLAAAGDERALAPAAQRAVVRGSGTTMTVLASTLRAETLVDVVRAGGGRIVVRRAGRVIASSLPSAPRSLPERGTRTIGGREYHVASFTARDAIGRDVTVSALVDRAEAAGTFGGSRTLAVGALLVFALLALLFALAVSRALQGQVARFLAAARRLGSGDFSTPVPVQGRDEFAELGKEFNAMAAELEQRIAQLGQERARLRESIRRIGQTFASNLDREALLDLGLRTAVDAVEADAGRASVIDPAGGLEPRAHTGDAEGAAVVLAAAERSALAQHATAEVSEGDRRGLAAPLAPGRVGQGPGGIIAVARAGRPFSDSEREVLSSLAGQASVSIDNVGLHEQVRRQAITDELTGLSNHRRFQETLGAELDRGRRFEQTVGLLMLDVDNFKRVNDTYGHPQGDEVLRAVARVVRSCARDVDEPARYGGEEMAVVLPHTDLEGAWRAAERVRTAIEALEVPLLDGPGALRVTASVGVAASAEAAKDELIAAADRALYEAKHTGKNRTVRGAVRETDPLLGG